MRASLRMTALVLGPVVLALAACEPTEEQAIEQTAQRAAQPEPFTPEVRAAVDSAFHSEQYAENVFLRVLSDHGEQPVFLRWLYGEIQHTSRLASLYLARGLEAPVSRWNITNVPSYPTIEAACEAATEIEEGSVELYSRFLDELELPPDVEQVFRFIRQRSGAHLDSFEQCAGA